MTNRFLAPLLLLLPVAVVTAQQEMPSHFEPLKPFLKTWRGEVASGAGEKASYDVQRWELALNGKAVRVMHSFSDGSYGGESIITWDQSKGSLAFYYFTTAGFFTNGTITFEDGKYVSHEMVNGAAQGITEVKSISEILPDGRMKGKSQYLKNGVWVDGREFTYVEDPGAVVVVR